MNGPVYVDLSYSPNLRESTQKVESVRCFSVGFELGVRSPEGDWSRA